MPTVLPLPQRTRLVTPPALRTPRSSAERRSPAPRWSVDVVKSLEELERHSDAIDDLAGRLAAPNPFYSLPHLRAGLRHLRQIRQPAIFLIRVSEAGERPRLAAVLPCKHLPPSTQIPFPRLRLWAHDYTCLTVPWVEQKLAPEALQVFLSYLGSAAAYPGIFELPIAPVGDAVDEAISDAVRRTGCRILRGPEWDRPIFDATTGDPVAAFGKSTRKRWRRRRRKLLDYGEARFVVTTEPEPCRRLIEIFLRIEDSSWKGAEGSSALTRRAHAAYLREAWSGAAERGELFATALEVAGRPVAANVNYISGGGCFAFKTAYDPALGDASPGLHLELEFLRHLARDETVSYVDSCTAVGPGWTESLYGGTARMRDFAIVTPSAREQFWLHGREFLRSRI